MWCDGQGKHVSSLSGSAVSPGLRAQRDDLPLITADEHFGSACERAVVPVSTAPRA